jgi:hypothetical protein
MPLTRSLKPFLLGLTIGILLTMVTFVFREMGRGMASWGALEIHTDTEVRIRIQNASIHLPPDAHTLYHAIAGFQDHQNWIKFTVPSDQIWTVVAQSIQKTESDFTANFPENLIENVRQNPNQTHDLSWWQPTSVTRFLAWSNQTQNPSGSHYFEDWLIDLDTATFYITRWDT